MIRRLEKGYHGGIGIVIDTGEPEESNPFCSRCMAIGELSRLKHRLYLDDKGKALPPPPDADNWLQCWTCGLTIPIRDVKLEGKISGIRGIEPVSNPFDNKRGVILGDNSKNRYKRLQRRKNKHPDNEVQKELDKGNIVTNYQTSMPT